MAVDEAERKPDVDVVVEVEEEDLEPEFTIVVERSGEVEEPERVVVVVAVIAEREPDSAGAFAREELVVAAADLEELLEAAAAERLPVADA